MVSISQTLAAANITTPAETLQLLSASEDITVKSTLATNPATPTDILRKLAECDNTFILTQLATNPTAPPDMLNKLAEHTNFLIIENVIKNPNVTTQTLQYLTTVSDRKTRLALAVLPTLPENLVYTLAFDPDVEVAASTLTCLKHVRMRLRPVLVIEKIFNILNTRNIVNETIMSVVLTNKVNFSQSQLIEIIELYDTNIKQLVKTNYTLTHPLLQQLLN